MIHFCKNCGYELERDYKNKRFVHKISRNVLHFCANPQSKIRYKKGEKV